MKKAMNGMAVLSLAIFTVNIIVLVIAEKWLSAVGYIYAIAWVAIFLLWVQPDNKEGAHWISTRDRLPDVDAYREKWDEYPEYIVMIAGAKIPTCLFFDGKEWYQHGEFITYKVTHWMEMPTLPYGLKKGK